ncbi:MAG: ribonucleotide-diphosphate reductase subunit alpha, partial [Sphingomonadaceae bacterium]|nr:ribonucleotide-diphosphate reductase subunit alpha [Sphingomonadaceae bacterium]
MDFRDTGRGADEINAGMIDVLEKESVVTETKSEEKAKPAPAPKKAVSSKSVDERRFNVVTDSSRDTLLTEFGKDTLQDRYLLPGESYQDLFARVAAAYADDEAHAQRLYDYISKLWFMPA